MNKSRKVFYLVGIVLMSFLFFTPILEAGMSYQLTFASRYIWRGFDMNPDNKPALQPSLTYNFGESGVALNLWGSISFEHKQLNEADITLSYTFKTPSKYSLSVGFTHYGWYFADDFTFKNNTSQEVYVSAGLPECFLSPNLSVYYDFGVGDGLYAQLGVAHRLNVAKEVGIDLSASLGYTSKQWVDKSGFTNLLLGATVPFKVDKVTISPFVNMIFILMDEINPGTDNEFVLGASIQF